MNKDKDFEEKKQGFVEVLKLMDMCNTARSSRDKQGAMSVATVFKNQYDAFISVGFSREEAMQLLMALVDGIAGDALGGK